MLAPWTGPNAGATGAANTEAAKAYLESDAPAAAEDPARKPAHAQKAGSDASGKGADERAEAANEDGVPEPATPAPSAAKPASTTSDAAQGQADAGDASDEDGAAASAKQGSDSATGAEASPSVAKDAVADQNETASATTMTGPAGSVVEAEPERLDGPQGDADDLKRISGVGPKLEALLNELGFWHFHQIAAWGPSEVEWVDARLTFKGRITRDNWIDQAKTLASEG